MKEATIQKIIDVKPVENSDFLDVVKVLGWDVVTKRNEFKVGEYVVYIEIDSLLPSDNPVFDFMSKHKYRVKTVKLRGTISQGIVFSLSILDGIDVEIKEGNDVSELLDITHYEKPIPANMKGQLRGNFPTKYIPKTDEIRIQSAPDVIDEISGKEIYETTKLDGTSGTYVICNGDYHVCSRNNSIKYDTVENENNVYVMMHEKYNLKTKLENYYYDIGIQAEICGPGIQKNRLELKEIDMFVFNIYKVNEHRYLDYNEMIETCRDLGLNTVPLVKKFIFDLPKETAINTLLENVKGLYDGTKTRREGSVFRTTKEMYSNALKGRLSFKVLNNEYLLHDEE